MCDSRGLWVLLLFLSCLTMPRAVVADRTAETKPRVGVAFASDAPREFGDLARVLEAQLTEELSGGKKKTGPFRADTLPGDVTHGRPNLEAMRAQAVDAGRADGATLVIYGRILSLEIAPSQRSSSSAQTQVRHHYEAPGFGSAPEIVRGRYTITERRDMVRIEIAFGIAECRDGRDLATEAWKREVVQAHSWIDYTGDAEAFPAELRGTPPTEPRFDPAANARGACREISRAIASRVTALVSSK